MSRHKVVRHDVHHHEGLGETGHRLVELARENGRNIAIGAGVVILAIVVALVMQSSQSAGEKSAAGLMAQAGPLLAQNQNEAAASKLQEIVQRFGGTPSGNQARFLLAGVELARGNAAQAEALYRTFLGKVRSGDITWVGGQRGLAVALENQRKFADAARLYEELAGAPMGDEERAHALLDAARARTLAADRPGATALYDRIVRDFPFTRAVATAKVLRAELAAAGG